MSPEEILTNCKNGKYPLDAQGAISDLLQEIERLKKESAKSKCNRLTQEKQAMTYRKKLIEEGFPESRIPSTLTSGAKKGRHNMTKQAILDTGMRIIDGFRFDKVHAVMKVMDWWWAEDAAVPSEKRLRDCAIQMLYLLAGSVEGSGLDHGRAGSGGPQWCLFTWESGSVELELTFKYESLCNIVSEVWVNPIIEERLDPTQYRVYPEEV